MKLFKSKVFLLLLTVLALLGLNWFGLDQLGEVELLNRVEKRVWKIQSQFDQAEKATKLAFEKKQFLLKSEELQNILHEDEQLFLFDYEGDSLVYWSTNRFVPDANMLPLLKPTLDTVIETSNGFYLVRKIVFNKGETTYTALLGANIYTQFPFENSFLRNGFSEQLLSADVVASFGLPNQKTYNVVSKNGMALFSIGFDQHQIPSKTLSIITLLVFMLFLSLLYALSQKFLKRIIHGKSTHHGLRLLLFFVAALAIRVGASFILSLLSIRNAEVFNTFYFGILLPATSFGALILDVQFLWVVVLSIVQFARPVPMTINKYVRFVALSLTFLLLYTTFIFVVHQLIYHVSEQLSFVGLFRFDLMSYLAFALVSVLTTVFFILCKKLFSMLLKPTDYLWLFLGINLLLAVAFLVIWQLILSQQFIPFILGILLVILFVMQIKFGNLRFGISIYVWFLLLFSVLLTELYYEVSARKTDSEQALTAFKLGLESDPMFEYLYLDLSREIGADSSIFSLLENAEFAEESTDEKLIKYLKDKFINGYFDRYNLTVTLCRPNDELMIQPENYLTSCAEYFEGIVSSLGTVVADSSLFYIDDNLLGPYYLAKINLQKPDATPEERVDLYLEFYFKYIPEGLGYPELLIDESKGFTRDFSSYSFANYQDSVLVYKFGSFLYPPRLQEMSRTTEGFFIEDRYRHYNYLLNSKRMLVVSKPEQKLIELVSPFSYFVFFLGIIGALFIGFGLQENSNWFSQKTSFRFKLQLLILSALGVSFAVIGVTSVIFITNLYSQKNDDFLAERTRSILIELEHKLKNESLEDEEINEYLHEILNKFSLVFFSDINLYDLNGNLMATSRPEIFEKNLLSGRMNPTAYDNMKDGRSLFFLHQEKIGNGTYYSSYIPYRNSDGNPVAYLNLPYFARESELRTEISAFLLTYINIFILLTGLSALLMLLLSRRLTLPLQMIQTKMKEVRIDKTNEPISWKGNDEIGQLVQQYNQLISELARSADLLARSERESAWREMAKQVAHEIKNPLTPMRLSVQYLQKAWDEKDPEIEKKIKQTTQTLVEQIDTLTAIATAFSDFARMPVNSPEKFDLTALIRRSVALYSEAPNTKITLSYPEDVDLTVIADQKNMGRAFGNLLKNAIQAIGHKKEGLIQISIERQDKNITIRLSDNGKGMTEQEQKRVFTPNFTTKSSGMGVGLSIVHNIVKAAGGTIDFVSAPGLGTTFTILLPAAE